MKSIQRSLIILAMLIAFIAMTQPAGAAGTATWTGVPNTSATTNWSDPLNWSPGAGASNPPGAADTASFGPTGSGVTVVDNVVDSNTTIASLLYINTSAANGHNTMILTNVTLTVNGLVNVGVANDTTPNTMSGPGNFTVNNVGGPINIGGSGGSTETSTLTLADGTNTIHVTTVSLGESASNNGRQCTLNLGNGVNLINADNINAGTGKGQGTIQFLGPTGSITIRNAAGTGRATMLLGKGTSGSGSGNGKLLFAGHTADILAGTVNMGGISGGDTGTPVATVTLDHGAFDATSILMGTSAGTTGPHTSSGTLTIGGDASNTVALIVNSPSGPGGGAFVLGNATISFVNPATNELGAGTLNINTNGTAQMYCSITKGNASQNTGAIALAGGTLIMEAATNTVGTPTTPIDNVTLDFASLQFSENGSSLNIATVNLSLNDTNVINIAALPPIGTLPTIIPIITFTNLLTAFNLGLGTLPGAYQGYITNDSATSISLVITNGPIVSKADQWGGAANINWDTTSFNWTNAGVVAKFSEGDFVTFDDNGRTNNVNLTAPHTPSSLKITNNVLNYTFSGAGSIIGSSGLIKSGSASLKLAESGGDSFVGGILVHGGTVILDNPNSNISGGLTNDIGTVVQIGNNDGNGVLPSGGIDDEGTLIFSRSNNLTVATTIAGGGSLNQNGSGRLTLTGPNAYTGNTTVGAGTLALSGSGSIVSPLTSVKNSTLDIGGAAGAVTLNTLALTNGIFNVSNNTASCSSLGISNSTIILAASIGSPANITATSLAGGGTTNTINVATILNLPDPPTLPIIVPLVSYTAATFGGGFNVGAILPPGTGGYISNDVANSAVELVITLTPQSITWNGGSATGNNWSDAANWSGTAIGALDHLIFDGTTRLNNANDTAASTLYTNMTFNPGAEAFTLNGNSIDLQGTMIDNSASTQTVSLGFTLSGNCTFDGGVSGGALTIKGGVTNISTGGRTVTLQGPGTINDLWATNNGVSGGGQLEFLLGSGGGTWTILDGTGTGALVPVGDLQLAMNVGATTGEFDYGTSNSAPNVDGGSGSVTVTGGGTSSIQTFNLNNGTLRVNQMSIPNNGNNFFNVNGGTLVLGSGSFNGGGGNGGAVYLATVNSGAIYSTNGGNFHIAQRGPSTFTLLGGLVQCGNLDVASGTAASGTGTVNLDGGKLICTNVTCGISAGNGSATFNFNGGTLQMNVNNANFFSANNLVPLTNNVSTNGAIIDTAGFNDTIALPLAHDPSLDAVLPTPDGGLTKLGAGILTLSSANSYDGVSTVSNGTLLVSGSLLGDAIAAPNGTLAGNGAVGGNVTANGTLAPGTAAATGRLTVTSNATISGTGTNVMKLNKTGATNDVLSVGGTLTYGGTLSLTNLSGTLAPSNTFKLFTAGTFAGTFAHIVPATPAPGLGWNTSTLATDGTLRLVATVNTTPTNIVVMVNGNQLTLSWPADHTGWRLQGQTNSLSTGLSSNWFDVPGSTAVNSVNVTINPANGTVFYRMVYP